MPLDNQREVIERRRQHFDEHLNDAESVGTEDQASAVIEMTTSAQRMIIKTDGPFSHLSVPADCQDLGIGTSSGRVEGTINLPYLQKW